LLHMFFPDCLAGFSAVLTNATRQAGANSALVKAF
jgi:hypothetical protein